MKTSKMLATMLAIIAVSSAAFATEDNEIEKKFRDSAVRAFEEAKLRGVKEVEGVAIDQFVEAAKKTNFVYDPRINVKFGNRRCASWHAEAKGVIDLANNRRVDIPAHVRINKECANHSEEDTKAIAVHEVAGANFKKDLNYEAVLKILGVDDGNTKGPMLDPSKISLPDRSKSSGGSTVVGGGGDGDDIIFRRECHKTLDRVSSPGMRLFGIPYEFYKVAFRKMRISPAADVQTIVEFRGPNVEQGGEPIAYVRSDLYRANEHGHKGLLCISAARLFVLYSPETLGLTEAPIDTSILDAALDIPSLNKLTMFYTSPALQVSNLILPRGRKGMVTWSNPVIEESIGKEAHAKTRERELDQYLEIIRDPNYASSLIQNYRALMRIGREVKVYTADSAME